MYIKKLTENLVQNALLLFEILSFEVYCRSHSDTGSRGSRRLSVSTIRGVGDCYVISSNVEAIVCVHFATLFFLSWSQVLSNAIGNAIRIN
jgi:hypothetical protein